MSVRSLAALALFVSSAAFAQSQEKVTAKSPTPAPAAAKATSQTPPDAGDPASLTTSKATAVTPKQVLKEQVAPALAMVSLEARCSSCDREVQGKITVNDQKISFCCATWMEAGAKVSAKCPYSFTVDLQQVKEQYLDTEGATPTWHVVTRDDVAYAFASIDQQATTSAFDRLKNVAPTVKSAKMIQEYAAALAVKSKPKLAASAAACE